MLVIFHDNAMCIISDFSKLLFLDIFIFKLGIFVCEVHDIVVDEDPADEDEEPQRLHPLEGVLQPAEEGAGPGDQEHPPHQHYPHLQYSTVQYSTVQYSTVQHSTAQYSTVQSASTLVV